MGDIFIKLKTFFFQGSILAKLIAINTSVFIILRLITVLFTLFQIEHAPIVHNLALPSALSLFMYKPWALLTYSILHADLLHLVFNMLWLYWFGQIFLQFFTQRQLASLYLLGVIAGGLFFLAAYLSFPFFSQASGVSYLMGASAAVMAVVFGVSFYQKEYRIHLFLFGSVKLIYLGLCTLLFDLISITSANAGGHVAHLGGAVLGICFAYSFSRGKDLSAGVSRLIDACVNLGKRRSRLKVTYRRAETDYDYNTRKKNESDTLDAILDKIKRAGYDSLSSEEKKTLFDASKR